jgi:hypothetical protein
MLTISEHCIRFRYYNGWDPQVAVIEGGAQ